MADHVTVTKWSGLAGVLLSEVALAQFGVRALLVGIFLACSVALYLTARFVQDLRRSKDA